MSGPVDERDPGLSYPSHRGSILRPAAGQQPLPGRLGLGCGLPVVVQKPAPQRPPPTPTPPAEEAPPPAVSSPLPLDREWVTHPWAVVEGVEEVVRHGQPAVDDDEQEPGTGPHGPTETPTRRGPTQPVRLGETPPEPLQATVPTPPEQPYLLREE